jgi:hypothetical protein
MSFVYVSNISPSDRFTRLSFQLDDGATAVIRQGESYDLSATEVARASRYVVLAASGSPATEVPTVTARLPVVGDLHDGDVPVWNAALAVFVPGAIGTGGGGGGPSYVQVVIDSGSGYAARPTGAESVMWIGPSDPDVAAHENDTWLPTT